MSAAARGTAVSVSPAPTAPLIPTGTTHLHLTQRGRVVFTALAAVPLVVGSLLVALNGGVAAATSDQATTTFTYVTVSAGQSLWQLAEKIAPTEDPREVIADIVSLNQLASEDVQPGQRLALPVS
ncbi:MAG TPA: LysM peptidoglycan-binding domain-containing protein [Glaciibacter sp.]|nr:LysM peptidoglycan-binding domain-containing protein [Glaciibacter sp.]